MTNTAQPALREQPRFTVYRLWFTVEVQTPLELPPWPGSALRGALLSALRRHYCIAPNDPDPGHSMRCPVCWLMAREDPDWRWGRTPARPYTVDLDPVHHALGHRYQPGERFGFGVTLFGVAINLLPYLILAVPEMGRMGVGRRLEENRGRRGQFSLHQVEAVHPLTGEREIVLAPGSRTVHTPTLYLHEGDVIAQVQSALEHVRMTGRVQVRFLTPTRLVHQKRLVKIPHFRPLFGRALDRIEALYSMYGERRDSAQVPGMLPVMDVPGWLRVADDVRLVEHDVRWIDLKSGSRRTGRVTPTGGFIGRAVYEFDQWDDFLPVLTWAQAVHVGKDAVKGNGEIQWSVVGEP